MARFTPIPPASLNVAGHVVKLVNDRYALGKLVSPNTKMTIDPNEMANLAAELQREFGVQVTREEFEAVRTVGDLIAIVAGKRAVGAE